MYEAVLFTWQMLQIDVSIYMKTKNVWICVLVHCIYNTVIVTGGQEIQGEMSAIQLSAQIFVIIILSLFIFKKEYEADVETI